jgi:hypothetical protein
LRLFEGSGDDELDKFNYRSFLRVAGDGGEAVVVSPWLWAAGVRWVACGRGVRSGDHRGGEVARGVGRHWEVPNDHALRLRRESCFSTVRLVAGRTKGSEGWKRNHNSCSQAARIATSDQNLIRATSKMVVQTSQQS